MLAQAYNTEANKLLLILLGVGLTFAKGSNGRSGVMEKFGIRILKHKGILVGLLMVKLKTLSEF